MTTRRCASCEAVANAIIVDTSNWVKVLRDTRKRGGVDSALAGADAYLMRFAQMQVAFVGNTRGAEGRCS